MESPPIGDITQLPEEIIQCIQSILTAKEAARINTLSRYWYAAWLTRPNLDFSDPSIPSRVKLAKKTLQKYEELKRGIQSFRLVMDEDKSIMKAFPSRVKSTKIGLAIMDSYKSAISMAMEVITKALELGAIDLDVDGGCCHRLILPHEVLVLGSDALVRLSVSRARIDQKVCLDSLINACYKLYSFFDIVSMCPLLEELKLSEFVLGEDNMLGSESGFCAHNLKVLSLNCVKIGEWLFGDLSSRFPRLKDLVLEGSIGHQVIRICSNSLEFMSCIDTGILRAEFDVPRIRRFKYSGSLLHSLSFTTIPRERERESEWESDISITFHHSYALNALHDFLHELSPSKISLHLTVDLSHLYGIPSVMGLPKPPIVVENLTVEMYAPYSLRQQLLDGLFSCCRPSFVNLYQLPSPYGRNKAHNGFTFFLFWTLIKGSGEKPSMSALQDLEEVNVEFSEGDRNKRWRMPLPSKIQLKWGGSL